jgi:hypothetical protein
VDWQASKAKTLAHLVTLASDPGWKDHAWFRAKELAREHPSLYGDVPDLLTAAMREQANEASRQG